MIIDDFQILDTCTYVLYDIWNWNKIENLKIDRTTLRIAAEPKDKYGTTPLHFAATNGRVQCIGVLVKFGAWKICFVTRSVIFSHIYIYTIYKILLGVW
jgi:ankyrin repeat protein